MWSNAGSDGLLWDADDLDSPPHTVTECLTALDPSNAWFYDTVADAQQGGISDADSVAEDMTLGNIFRNSAGHTFNIP